MKYHKIEMSGKFINEKLTTLPTWQSSDEGRVVFVDGDKYIGSDTRWIKYNESCPVYFVTQNAHALTVLTPVYFNGTSWVKAIATSKETIATHIITTVHDVNTFDVAQTGTFKSSSHGLTVGDTYYTSDTTAGTLTNTEPDIISNPMIKIIDIDTVCILPYIPTFNNEWHVVDSNYTIQRQDRLLLDSYSASGSFTITFPPSGIPKVGDEIEYVDSTGNISSFPVTLDTNGTMVMGTSGTWNINTNNEHKKYVFMNNIYGWREV